jgi:hypothetical protein
MNMAKVNLKFLLWGALIFCGINIALSEYAFPVSIVTVLARGIGGATIILVVLLIFYFVRQVVIRFHHFSLRGFGVFMLKSFAISFTIGQLLLLSDSLALIL